MKYLCRFIIYYLYSYIKVEMHQLYPRHLWISCTRTVKIFEIFTNVYIIIHFIYFDLTQYILLYIFILLDRGCLAFYTYICRWMRFCHTAFSSALGARSTITRPLFLGILERVPDRSDNKGLHPVMAGLLWHDVVSDPLLITSRNSVSVKTTKLYFHDTNKRVKSYIL